MNAQAAVFLSSAFHLSVFWIAAQTLPSKISRREPESIKVRIAEPPKTISTPAPVVEVTPKPRPPVRVDRRKPPPEKPVPKPEVRAGLSDSLAKEGTARENAPVIAQGNSSMAGVNPEDANKPVPPPAAPEEAESEVFEALADTPARCPVPPNLELTIDALNAGLTNAEVIIEVAVNATGSVENAKLKTGTGYEIDNVALKAAMKLKCTPAVLSGKTVRVAGKKLVWKVMYD
jgi:hypothetical protein